MKNRLGEILEKPYRWRGRRRHPFPTHPLCVQGFKVNVFLVPSRTLCKKRKLPPRRGIEPQSPRVTGEDTQHYTTEDFDSKGMRFV